MNLVHFAVAGKPLAKGRVRFTTTGHAYTPGKTVAYEGRLAAAAQEAMAGRPPVGGPVDVFIDVEIPIPTSWSKKKQSEAVAGLLRPVTKPDIDNYVKVVADGLNMIVWIDDRQIVSLTVNKYYGLNPQMKVTVRDVF